VLIGANRFVYEYMLITDILYLKGDFVSKGDVIGEIDSSIYNRLIFKVKDSNNILLNIKCK
jgi:hypothetical protein